MLSKLYPDLTEIFNITKTYEGRDLIGIKVSAILFSFFFTVEIQT